MACEALAKVHIYYPGNAKRFQGAIKQKLTEAPECELSPSSWQFVRELLHTYRKQVPAHIHERHCPNESCQRRMAEQKALERQLQFAF